MGTNKVFAVFGLGTFGLTVAETLTEKGATVIAIDSDENQVNLIKNKVDTALVLDTTDERAMEKAPLDEIDTAVIALGEDLETSIITTALIKKRGIPIIIARAVTSIHEQVLRQIGATEIVNLQRDGGERLAQKLVAKEVLDTVPISGDFSISEIEIPKGFFQEKPENMALKEKFGIHILENTEYAVRNNNSSLYVARKYLKNTYICSADNYFTVNPFEQEVEESYYSALYADGPTKEWCLECDEDDWITNVKIGGKDSWYMMGHVFFSEKFSEKFVEILTKMSFINFSETSHFLNTDF